MEVYLCCEICSYERRTTTSPPVRRRGFREFEFEIDWRGYNCYREEHLGEVLQLHLYEVLKVLVQIVAFLASSLQRNSKERCGYWFYSIKAVILDPEVDELIVKNVVSRGCIRKSGGKVFVN